MKYIKPIAATLAVALSASAFAGYAPSKGTHSSCAKGTHINALIMGNSARGGTHSSNSCWFERIRISGYGNMFYNNTRTRMASTYNRGLSNDGSSSYTNVAGTFDWGNNAKDQSFVLSDASLFVDADISPVVDAHLNLHYAGTDAFSGVAPLYRHHTSSKASGVEVENEDATTIGSTRTVDNHINLDEAFVVYHDKSRTPLYVKIGSMFNPFGSYGNPYAPTPGLSQMLTQDNITGIEMGLVSGTNWEASAWLYDADLTNDTGSGFNKWGARLGYKGTFNKVGFAASASFINDARTLSEGDSGVKDYFMKDISNASHFDREGAYDLHLAMFFDHIKANVGYTAFASDLATATHGQIKLRAMSAAAAAATRAETVLYSAQPKVWSFGLGYEFNAMGHGHRLNASYETASSDGGAIFHAKDHWKVAYTTELSDNFEGYASYDDYRLHKNIGWNGGDDGASANYTTTGYTTSRNTARVWLVGVKAHI